MTQAVAAEPTSKAKAATYILGGAGALFEGYDLQSAGVAASKLVPAFDLVPSELGWIFTANTIGLFFGAAAGGWLSDRVGRKGVLAASMMLFGIFTVGSAMATSYEMMLAMRFLTGVGLGAALPNLIAIVAESGSAKGRATKVAMLTAAIPIGGMFASILVLAVGPDIAWQTIFHVGGWPPIVIGVLMIFLMPESHGYLRDKAERLARVSPAVKSGESVGQALFGDGRGFHTVLLWGGFFFTLMVLYLLLNWLPSLLILKGFSQPEAIRINFGFALGGGLGALSIAWIYSKLDRRVAIVAIYAVMAASLLILAEVTADVTLAMLAAFAVGFFVVGAQFLLYGLSSTYYPTASRATGVGWAVAIGRLGAIAGPALAGLVLATGQGSSAVIGAILPCVLLAMLALLVLLWRKHESPA